MFHDHVDHQLSNSGDDTTTMQRRCNDDATTMQRRCAVDGSCRRKKKIESSVGFEAGDT